MHVLSFMLVGDMNWQMPCPGSSCKARRFPLLTVCHRLIESNPLRIRFSMVAHRSVARARRRAPIKAAFTNDPQTAFEGYVMDSMVPDSL